LAGSVWRDRRRSFWAPEPDGAACIVGTDRAPGEGCVAIVADVFILLRDAAARHPRRVLRFGSQSTTLPGEIMASETVHVFNDMNFENEVLQSGETVLVDFTAAWCGPCKRLAPIVEEVAEATKGKVKVGKLDIDEAPITASKLGIRSVPTLIVFKDGKAAGQHLGLTTKAKILDLVGGG
jgi:thioredoxin 1